MSQPLPHSPGWLPAVLATAVLVVGLGVTALVALQAQRSLEVEGETRFNQVADRVAGEIERRFANVQHGLNGIRGMLLANPLAGRSEFRDYVESLDLTAEFPGIRGFGEIRRVERPDLDRLIAEERADGHQPFTVRTGGSATDCYIITSVFPREPNRQAWGYDIGSEPIRRAAAERAAATGRPALTGPIVLVQDGGRTPGFLLLLPVYHRDSPQQTTAERFAALRYLVYSPIIAREFLAGLEDVTTFPAVVVLHDSDAAGTRLFPVEGEPPPMGRFRSATTLAIHGRNFRLEVGSTPALEAAVDHGQVRKTVVAGGMITLLAAILIWSLGRSRARVLRAAEAMTMDLRRATEDTKAALHEAALYQQTIDRYGIVSVADLHGRITFANDAFCAISGYSRAELIGQDHRLLNSGFHPPSFWQAVWTELRAGRSWRGVVCNRAKDGSLYWIDALITPFTGADGRIERYVSIRFDITAQKKAEAERAQLIGVLEQTPDFVGVADLDGRLRYHNRAARRMVGLGDDQDLSHLQISDLHTAEATHRIEAEVLPMLHTIGVWQGESALRHRDGSTIPVSQVLLLQRDCQGRPEAISTIVRDLRAQKRAEAEQRTVLALQRGILDSANLCIVATDPTGLVVLWNRTATDWLQWTAEEMIGHQTPLAIHDPAEVRRRAAELTAELEIPVEADFAALVTLAHYQGTPDEREWTYVRKDGSRFPVRLSITALTGPGGSVTGYLGVAADITDLRRQHAELVQAKEAAEAGLRAKAGFLAVMSHEIRTPMNGVIGMSNLLVKTELGPLQREFAETIRSCGESLLTLINDILDFSKLEAGKVELERLPMSLAQVLDEAGMLFTTQAGQKGVALRLHPPANPPPLVLGDPTRLRQILLNLLSNALKFTSAGAVDLTLEIADAGPGRVGVVLEVRDTGIGMTPAQVARLGEPFVQADTSTTRQFGGTGLGMTITKSLVALMGGTFTVTSTPGQGSCFRIGLALPTGASFETATSATAVPALALPVAEIKPPRARAIHLDRILVAEDARVNQRLITFLLKDWATTIEVVADGSQAVAAVVASAQPYDLVLMDCEMPVMDGFEATIAIRERERVLGLPRLPIVALTAHALEGARDRCLAAGMDDYLSKPVRESDLQVMFDRRFAGRTGSAAGDDASRSDGLLSGIRAILVDADLRAVAASLIDEQPVLMDSLAQAEAAADRAGIARLAHQVKGWSAGLELNALTAAARDLELAARQDGADLAPLLADLRHQLGRAVAAFEELLA